MILIDISETLISVALWLCIFLFGLACIHYMFFIIHYKKRKENE